MKVETADSTGSSDKLSSNYVNGTSEFEFKKVISQILNEKRVLLISEIEVCITDEE